MPCYALAKELSLPLSLIHISAQFKWCEQLPPCPEELSGRTIDLGLMLYDMDYSDPEDIRPLFFRGKLVDGVLDVPAQDSGEVRG